MTQSKTKTMLNQRKIRLIKYFSMTITLLGLSCITSFVDPLERLLDDQLSMRKGSFLFYLWEKPPLPVIMQVYIFNITNAEAFLSGTDKKLKVVEIGPYVYQEILENKNATFHENGTLSFVPSRYSIPMPERSIGDPHKDVIVAANLPLIGFSNVAAKHSTLAAISFSTLAKSTNSKPLLNLTVHDYLWGYTDNLIKFARTVLPDYVDFDKFGLMDRLFDEGHNLVSMNLPKAIENMKKQIQKEAEVEKELLVNLAVAEAQIAEKLDVEYDEDYENEVMFNNIPSMAQQVIKKQKNDTALIRDYSINLWNGSPGLKRWDYDDADPEKNSPCNTLRGSYDGTLFPKKIVKDEQFKVYRKAFCRTLPIHYSHSGTQYGIDAFWFKLSDKAFDDSLEDPESMCYCAKEKKCMKRGLGNITPCYYNIPVSVSLPHFYNSDPSLVNEVEGIQPIKEKHESIIVMQPRLGVPMKVHSRIQLNLMGGETMFNSDVQLFDNLVLPVFWLEIAIEDLTTELHIIVNLAFNVLPALQAFVIYGSLLGGVFYSSKLILNIFSDSSCSDESKIKFNTKASIKYTAVFPYIKREMAKFEEREREMSQQIENV